jgi:uncharacterized protein YjiS (DUF1127 family)
MNNNRVVGTPIGMTPIATPANRQWAVSGLAILTWMRRAGDWYALAVARRHQRAALRELDNRLLRDIGKTRREAEAEASKLFWR